MRQPARFLFANKYFLYHHPGKKNTYMGPDDFLKLEEKVLGL